tara:strand:- start:1327 stop:2475 length:1149 start_codon:yes stop_codon:yes gene_type:complete
MKKIISIFIILISFYAHAQTALSHIGTMQIHNDAKVGFHTSFINNAPFDQNLGTVGFYGSNKLIIDGTVAPVFYDLEIYADQGVNLNISADVTNNVNFIYGNITTPKSLQDIYFSLVADAMYNGENNDSKVDGYALITYQQAYTFPVGDKTQLRPLILNSSNINLTAKCAYFFEDPNTPLSFSETFNTGERARQLAAVSTNEFWRLESSVPSTVTISWNNRSNISTLTDKTENLLVVGWSKANQEWEILGNSGVSGNADSGIISSDSFIPDDYEIITIGSLLVPQDRLTIPNFYLSPNGDGINDALVIEELDLSPNNTLKLYDRNGLLVFQKENYTNEFIGISNTDNMVINKEQGLPSGVYFYVVNLLDLGYEFQGFLYLAR